MQALCCIAGMKGALVEVRSRHLAGDMYVLENPDCLSFALIFREREQLAGGLGYLIKKCLLCFQKGFSVIRQMLPHLWAHVPSGTHAAGICLYRCAGFTQAFAQLCLTSNAAAKGQHSRCYLLHNLL